MTRKEKLAKVLEEGKWIQETVFRNDYGEEVYRFVRDKEGDWLKATLRADSIEVYGSENGKSTFFRDDPKPESRSERIRRLAATDVNFPMFVGAIYTLKQQRSDLCDARDTLLRLGIKVGDVVDEAIVMYNKKEDAADRALEDVYGISWHGHKEAFVACGLE